MAGPSTKQDGKSSEQKRMESMAADLSSLRKPNVQHGEKLDPAVAAEIQIEAETKNGLRCFGCGERVTVGFRFTQLQPMLIDGKAAVGEGQITACNECDFAAKARKVATCMELVEFVWLDKGRAPEDVAPAEDGEAEEAAPAKPKAPSRAKRAAAKRRSEG